MGLSTYGLALLSRIRTSVHFAKDQCCICVLCEKHYTETQYRHQLLICSFPFDNEFGKGKEETGVEIEGVKEEK